MLLFCYIFSIFYIIFLNTILYCSAMCFMLCSRLKYFGLNCTVCGVNQILNGFLPPAYLSQIKPTVINCIEGLQMEFNCSKKVNTTRL